MSLLGRSSRWANFRWEAGSCHPDNAKENKLLFRWQALPREPRTLCNRNARRLRLRAITRLSSSDQTRFFNPFFPAITDRGMSTVHGGIITHSITQAGQSVPTDTSNLLVDLFQTCGEPER